MENLIQIEAIFFRYFLSCAVDIDFVRFLLFASTISYGGFSMNIKVFSIVFILDEKRELFKHRIFYKYTKVLIVTDQEYFIASVFRLNTQPGDI